MGGGIQDFFSTVLGLSINEIKWKAMERNVYGFIERFPIDSDPTKVIKRRKAPPK